MRNQVSAWVVHGCLRIINPWIRMAFPLISMDCPPYPSISKNRTWRSHGLLSMEKLGISGIHDGTSIIIFEHPLVPQRYPQINYGYPQASMDIQGYAYPKVIRLFDLRRKVIHLFSLACLFAHQDAQTIAKEVLQKSTKQV